MSRTPLNPRGSGPMEDHDKALMWNHSSRAGQRDKAVSPIRPSARRLVSGPVCMRRGVSDAQKIASYHEG
jgi:hypothetical protein